MPSAPANEGSLPAVATSDGAVGVLPSSDVLAEREAKHAEWLSRVSRPRPVGHAFVWTRSEPLAFTPFDTPLSEATVALVTTGGVHLAAQPGFDVFGEEGDWTSREIPGDVDTAQLTVTHTHYATEDARRDVNVMFPLDRLRELVADGTVGASSPVHYGFMGFIPDPSLLVAETAPAVGRELQRRGVDVVVLTGS